jgi:uncharacterized repeat protein (TIGR01451 family)
MNRNSAFPRNLLGAFALALAAACTSGDKTYTSEPHHGFDLAGNWDHLAAHIAVEPASDVNPVRSQHVLVATVTDADGQLLGGRRVEWMLPAGGVGAIVAVDEHGFYGHDGAKDDTCFDRADVGDKIDNSFAVTHTNVMAQTLCMGTEDPADDVVVGPGQTWVSITSASEGQTDVIAYAPGISSWADHKAFAVKHWMDVSWTFPGDATNRMGTDHNMAVKVVRHSDGAPLAGYEVGFKVSSGPAATLEPGAKDWAVVKTGPNGVATATLRQVKPVAGENVVHMSITRPGNKECCEPDQHIADGSLTKTWVAPSIEIVKKGPATAKKDEVFAYSIAVRNTSNISTREVVVTDALPEGLAYVGSNPPATVDGQKLTWNLGELAAGGSKDLSVSVKGTRTGKFSNCAVVAAESGLQGKSCADTVITAPALALTKTAPAEVLLCDGITYTYTVKNGGDGPATNVKITDTLPAGLTASGQGNVAINVGTLAAGESKTFTQKVAVAKTGSYTNAATATADGGLKSEAKATTKVVQPVLTIAKKCPEKAFIGRPIHYEITVTNTGDAVSKATTLVDTLPAGATFVSATDGGTAAAGKVTWNLGDMAPGASRTVKLVANGSAAGTLTNSATASGTCADKVTASCSTSVQGIPALLLEAVDNPDPIEVGSNVTYTITVTNQGSAEDKDIVVVATLPAELTFVSATGPTAFKVEGSKITFEGVKSLAPKAKATFTLQAKANAAGDVRFAVEMRSSTLKSPVNETESTNLY